MQGKHHLPHSIKFDLSRSVSKSEAGQDGGHDHYDDAVTISSPILNNAFPFGASTSPVLSSITNTLDQTLRSKGITSNTDLGAPLPQSTMSLLPLTPKLSLLNTQSAALPQEGASRTLASLSTTRDFPESIALRIDVSTVDARSPSGHLVAGTAVRMTPSVPINFTAGACRFVYLQHVLDEVADELGIALQDDSDDDLFALQLTQSRQRSSSGHVESCSTTGRPADRSTKPKEASISKSRAKSSGRPSSGAARSIRPNPLSVRALNEWTEEKSRFLALLEKPQSSGKNYRPVPNSAFAQPKAADSKSLSTSHASLGLSPPKAVSSSTPLELQSSTIATLHEDFWLRSEQQCSKRTGIVQGPWHNHSCWLDSALVGLLSVATGLKEWLMHMDCLFITNPSMCAKLEMEETFALQGRTLAFEIWSLIREYTQLAYDYDSKPVKDASDAYFELRERIISLVIVLSNERKSDYKTPLKRGEYSNPWSWLVSLYTFTIETHFQRAGYCSACQCVQIEILARRHFIVDWPVLLSSLNLSEPTLSEVFGSLVGQPAMADVEKQNTGRRYHKSDCIGRSYTQIISITSLPRVLVFNINNQYPRHEQRPRELRLAVSGQMELVWSLRSEVRHILSGEHFATDAIVSYGEEAARYHFDAMRGHLAYPTGNRTTNGLVTMLFYELEQESHDLLPSFNALLDQQWHELWGLYYDSEALADLPSEVSTMPPVDGSFDEGKGVWKMQDASVLFEGFKSRCDLLGQLCSSGRSCQ
ncbi:BZ3500_MvSof-1268-A1-R1_Chr1-1g01213 [Microbotryum saponariae]|uniref:BZ3500_MvSof-1268-A1-R1_Chr1-1g01213 protein n=1 Tax=Microbotryum saponariae TaxID=289078 RepID=A0A2X0KQA5_9BASI|nr:BZ3500_MvSof-1268-A1-R1_Chr1-1g01213 [Microbotryum saponariae]SCZ93686.1 BZ3501_MvSof-1269-A2-R1_Chr1-1g00809 [Microbotryum saponariae]